MKRLGSVLTMAVLGLSVTASGVAAWSGGPLFDVTDLDPKCAVCHSTVGREAHRLEPPAFAATQLPENRHYKAIEDGTGPYQSMSPADRQKLLADIKTMDQNASVSISAPESLRPGQEAQITVTLKGGSGLIGTELVDTDLKRQARTIQGDGWVIVGPPTVWGSDGKEQTNWVDRRGPGLRKNLNSAVIFDRKADIAAGQFASGKVTWTVRAPQEPGTYSVTAAFHYGTEKASPVGSVTTPTGAVVPRGGVFGASGRVMFAKPVTVTVR